MTGGKYSYGRGGVDPKVAERQVAKRRPCIKCHETFDSTHAGNRLCPSCKAAVDRADLGSMI